jgi:hypothetical protein
MRIIKILLNSGFVLFLIFCIGGFLIPEEWSVSRSLLIKASAERIYPFVNDFKEWDKWAPWNASKDSSLQYTYEGPEVGVGAKQNWTSDKMGKGWMQMTQANPQRGVSYDLYIDMGHSQSTLQGKIRFSEEANATRVTWTDRGNSGKSFTKRWMSLMLKQMLGKEFDTGLNHLKELVEKT